MPTLTGHEWSDRLTTRDIVHIEQEFCEARDEDFFFEPVIIMLSIGYAEVFPDGDVVAYNEVVYQVDAD